MFKPLKRSIYLNKKILNTIIKSDWNNLLYIPKRLIGYHYYRGIGDKLYCEIIAKDKNKKYISLPYKFADKDLRSKLREIKFVTNTAITKKI